MSPAFHTSLGVPVFVEPSHALPLVDVELVLLRGATGDPAGREGLTYLCAQLARRGPKGMKAEAFDERLDALGATLGVSVSAEHVRLGGTVLRRNLARYLALIGRMLSAPGLRADDFARLRRRTEAELVALRDHDRALAGRAFRRQLFGAHPYARPVSGTLSTLRQLRREDIRARHQSLVRREHLLIGVSGDVTAAELAPLVEDAFGDLPSGAVPRPAAKAARPPAGRRVIVVDKPERSQTQLYVGTLGVRIGDPDYHALLVADTGFGGTFTSRLVKAVRSDRGWSYGAGTKVGADRQPDAWTMWTHPSASQVLDCLRLELELFDAWVERGLDASEVRRSKRYLVKSHAFDVETAGKRLELQLETAAYGLPRDWHPGFVKRVNAVDRARAHEAVQRHLDPSRLSIGLVATADAELLTGLRALPGVRSVTTIGVGEV